jgi:superfamily I DNA and/or RNA helicase
MLGTDLNQNPSAKKKAMKRVAEARLVFTTCVGAALGLLRNQKFETVIIDEVSQQTEPASLIPLVKGCRRAVLVGDHVQLRATVRSHASTLDFDTSLMERLWTAADTGTDTPIGRVMLDTQYRMHPDICKFPSAEFYQGQLSTATICRDILIPPSNFPWPSATHTTNSRCVFVQCSEPEDHGRKSKANPGQARLCKSILALLSTPPTNKENGGEVPGNPVALPTSPPSLAILTPYTRQADLLRETCPGVLVSSIDGFQGQEADIIIFVTVRCNLRGEIGFLKDMRRLNVALTRAKAGLIIIGDQGTLRMGKEGEEAGRLWDRSIEGCAKVKLP